LQDHVTAGEGLNVSTFLQSAQEGVVVCPFCSCPRLFIRSSCMFSSMQSRLSHRKFFACLVALIFAP
jgi:hypothetical protein